MVGEGRGVTSSMAAICGEEMVELGDTEPAVECSHDRILGIRCVRLAAEALDTIRGSRSLDTEDVRRKFCKSVRICSSCNMFAVSLGGEVQLFKDKSAFCLKLSRLR